MPVGELCEIVREYGLRRLHKLGLFLSLKLKKKALAQISGTYPRRLELLNHLQHIQNLLRA